MGYSEITRGAQGASAMQKNVVDISPRRFREYKVIRVSENGCATILLGASILPTDIMESKLNALAQQGWQVITQIVEKQRLLLFWQRESVIITLGR